MSLQYLFLQCVYSELYESARMKMCRFNWRRILKAAFTPASQPASQTDRQPTGKSGAIPPTSQPANQPHEPQRKACCRRTKAATDRAQFPIGRQGASASATSDQPQQAELPRAVHAHAIKRLSPLAGGRLRQRRSVDRPGAHALSWRHPRLRRRARHQLSWLLPVDRRPTPHVRHLHVKTGELCAHSNHDTVYRCANLPLSDLMKT